MNVRITYSTYCTTVTQPLHTVLVSLYCTTNRYTHRTPVVRSEQAVMVNEENSPIHYARSSMQPAIITSSRVQPNTNTYPLSSSLHSSSKHGYAKIHKVVNTGGDATVIIINSNNHDTIDKNDNNHDNNRHMRVASAPPYYLKC